MKTRINKLYAKFEPDARFELKPAAAPFRVTEESDLEKLKSRLLQEVLSRNEALELNAPLRRAANEAAALAWATRFPLLFFPTIFEEKARSERLKAQKQQQIRARSETMLAEVA